MDQISLTENAAKQVQTLLADEPAGHSLRLVIEGGGCSGFQYKFDLVTPPSDDLVFENHGAKITTNEVSLGFLKGSTIDYVEELGGSCFKVDNPNATANCGCGSSFSA